PGNEGAPVGQGQGQGVDRPFDGPLGGGAGDEALGRRGRVLALGQPVDHVVLHDVGDVDVPADGVEEVVPPDAVAIAVARHRDDVEARVGQLGPLGDGKGPAVQGGEAV